MPALLMSPEHELAKKDLANMRTALASSVSHSAPGVHMPGGSRGSRGSGCYQFVRVGLLSVALSADGE